VIFFGVLHLKPQDALTFGAVLQTARLMGGEIGSGFITTLARVREQVASNLIGLHVQAGDAQVLQRIGAYGAATTRDVDPVDALHRGETVLDNLVRAAATTQAVMDCFVLIAFLTAVALVLVVTRKAAPEGPASAPPSLRCPHRRRREVGAAASGTRWRSRPHERRRYLPYGVPRRAELPRAIIAARHRGATRIA
jgi:DHA2 family multidrug resistance protein